MNIGSASLLRKDIKIRHLVLLEALWDTRSVHKAATRLHITQPAATKLLGELERRLDLRLFDRSATGITPTIFAESLVRHAITVLSHLGHAGAELQALKDQRGGRLVVGTMLAGSIDLVPDAVRELKHRMPALTVEVKEVPLHALNRSVQDGTLDLAIGRLLEGADTHDLVCEALCDEPMTVIARCGHPIFRESRDRAKMLANHGWVWPHTGQTYRLRLDEMFKLHCNATPTDVVESNSFPIILGLVSRSDRLAIVPESTARLLERLEVAQRVGFRVPIPSSLIGVVSRTTPHHPTSTALLIHFLKRCAGAIQPEKPEALPYRLPEAI